MWMYGGIYGPSDAGAIKAAGLELLHFDQIISRNLTDVCTPLVSLIDYQGYRVISVSFLPVAAHTLCYGSNNGGKLVHNDNLQVTARLNELFQSFNLKQHQIGSSGVILTAPGDVEGHGMFLIFF